MPDYRKTLESFKQRAEEEALKGKVEHAQEHPENYVSKDNSLDQNITAMFNQAMEKMPGAKAPNPNAPKPIDFSAANWANTMTPEQKAEQQNVADMSYGGDTSQTQLYPNDYAGWGPAAVYQDWQSKFADNFAVGFGNAIMAGTGNTIDGLLMVSGLENASNNALTNYLVETGNRIAQTNETYQSEAIKNPEWFNPSLYINPEFWAVHGAQFAPQIAEIAATYGAAAVIEKGISAGGRKLFKELAERKAAKLAAKTGAAGARVTSTAEAEGARESLKALGKNNPLVTTTDAARGITEVEGTGRGLGTLLRDTGELSTFGKGVVRGVSGGLLTNVKVSLMDAGEVYNQYRGMQNPDGTPMFTDEELGRMASGAFANNMQYLGMDMLSWGMTFGGGWGKLSSIGKTLAPAAQRKLAGSLFTNAVTPIYQKLAKLGGVMAMEGLEETVQESFEEWSKFRAYRDVAGTHRGFPGFTENHQTFWDYYQSKDADAIKAISFGMGMAAAGAFNFKEVINRNAENAAKFYNKAENLKTIFKKGSLGDQMHDHYIRQQMAELVFDGKEEAYEEFMGEMLERGIVDEEKAGKYADLFTEMRIVKNDIMPLSIDGKRAFMNNVVQEAGIVEKINIETEKHNKNVAFLTEQLAGDEKGLEKALAKQQNTYEEQMTILGNILAHYQRNKRNILKGEPATKVDVNTTVDPEGQEKYTAPEPETQEAEDEENDDQDIPTMKKSMYQRITKDGMEALRGIGLGALFGDKNANPKNPVTVNPDEDPNANPPVVNPTVTNQTNPQAPPQDADEQEVYEYNGYQYPTAQEARNKVKSTIDKKRKDFRTSPDFDDMTFEDVGAREVEFDNEEKAAIKKIDDVEQDYKNKKSKAPQNQSGNPDDTVTLTPLSIDTSTPKVNIPQGTRYDHDVEYHQKAIKRLSEKLEEEKKHNKGVKGWLFADKSFQKELEEDIKEHEERLALLQSNPVEYYNKVLKEQRDKHNKDIDNDPKYKQELLDKFGTADYDKLRSDYVEDVNYAISEIEKANKPGSQSNPETTTVTSQDNGNVSGSVDSDTTTTSGSTQSDTTTQLSDEVNAEIKLIQEDPDLTQAEKDYQIAALIRENTTNTTLAQEKENQKKNLGNKKGGNGDNNANPWNNNGKARKAEKAEFDDDMIGAVKKKTSNFLKAFGKAFARVEHEYFAKRDIAEGKMGANLPTRHNRLFQWEVNSLRIAQINAVNDKLATMFPDAQVHLTVVDDLYKYVGPGNVGYTLAAAVYVDTDVWNQDSTFQHEMAHIYFPFMKDDANTKAIINSVAQNEKLLKFIKMAYADDVRYRRPDGKSTSLGKIIDHGLSQGRTNEEIMKEFQEKLASGHYVELPLNEQPVVMEELFAYGMEGPLHEEFGDFVSKDKENVRQYLAKKWWGRVKQLAENSQKKYSQSEKLFLEKMSQEQTNDYANAKEFIFQKFREGIKGREAALTFAGRAKIEAEENEERKARLEKIAEQYNEQAAVQGIVSVKPETDTDTEDKEKNTDDAFDIAEDEIIGDKFFEANRLKTVRKASEYIRVFSRNYNQMLRRKHLARNGNKATDWSVVPMFDRDMFNVKLMQMAWESTSNLDFIDKIKESDVKEIFEFNKFLEQLRPNDHLVVLSGMKFVYGNQSMMNSVVGYMSKHGDFIMEDNLNNKEISQVDRAVMDFIKNGKAYFKHQDDYFNMSREMFETLVKGDFGYQKYLRFVEAIKKIKSEDYTYDDLYNFFDVFAGPNIDLTSILDKDFITINGKNYTADTVARYVISTNFNDNVSIFAGQGEGPKAIIRDLAKALAVTNRRYTAEYTVLNANGKQEPVRKINNALIRTIKRMEEDAFNMTKTEFLNQYSNVHRKGAGSKSNPLLNFMYEQMRNGEKVDINQFHGVKNDFGNNSTVASDSNDVEMGIWEALAYMADNSNSDYLMETGRYSDSPVSYMMRVPKIKAENLGKISNGNFLFNAKSKATLQNAHALYASMSKNPDITFDEFLKELQQEIQHEVEFFENNKEAFTKSKKGQAMFEKDGKLTDAAKLKVGEYVINQAVNSLGFNELFFPSFKGASIVKRQKAGHSPGFVFNENIRVQPIYFVDRYVNGQSVSNSGWYILREDAELIRKAGGEMMPLNNSYKLLMTGVEYDNENFAHKNMFDKGYTTMLDDEYIKDNPSLAGLYAFMKQQRQTYIERHGPISQDLLSGMPTHFMYAAPMSSVKADNLPQAMIEEYEKGKERATKFGEQFTLEALNTLEFDRQQKVMDEWYYDKNGQFVGVSGENLMVQQVMDKESYMSNTPIQMIRSILTNSGINGSLDLAEEIQMLITDSMEEVLSEYRVVMHSGDAEAIKNFIKDRMKLEDVDPTQRHLLTDDNLSPSIPALRELATNTITNAIRIAGNKFQAPGGLAQAKPPTHRKQYITNGTNELAFYNRKVKDGKLDGHTMGEAVLPAYMNRDTHKKGRLQARKYFVQNDQMAENAMLPQLYAQAQQDLRERGIKAEPGKVMNDQGIQIGWYAQGDTIMATRIPSHGVQSTGVFEVIDFDTTGASNIQLPARFSLDITGGDFDGDMFFIQHKGKGKKYKTWDKAFDKMTDLWLSKDMEKEVMLEIDFKDEAEQAVKDVQKIFPNEHKNFHFSPHGKRTAYRNTMISKNNIGTAANLHSIIGMLSAYTTKLHNPITINEKQATAFQDREGESRSINSAKIFNLIMDNSKNQFADDLGINEHTITAATMLRNLGFDLSEIGLIMNTQAVLEMNKLLSSNDNIFTEKQSINEIEKIVRKKINKAVGRKSEDVGISTHKDKINSANNQHAILDMMVNLGSINEEMMAISTIMAGHNKLANNPFILARQMEKFNKVMNNEDNKGIEIPARFTQNPLVKRYVDVFNFNMDIMQRMDPVHNKTGVQVFERLTDGILRNMKDEEIKKVHNDIEKLMTARSLGLNNVSQDYMESLIEKSGKNNIFDRLGDYIGKQMAIIIEENKDDVRKSISSFDNNMLLRQGLRYSLAGNSMYISLNNNFFNENIHESERKRMVDEFDRLPQDLKNDLMLYDLFTHGLKGPQSMFNIMENDFKHTLSHASERSLKDKSVNELTNNQAATLIKRIVQTNSGMFRDIKNKEKGYFIFDGQNKLSPEFFANNPQIVNNMRKGKETIFRYQNANGKTKVFHFVGWRDQVSQFKNTAPDAVDTFISDNYLNHTGLYDEHVFSNGIGVMAIPDQSTGNPVGFKPSTDNGTYTATGKNTLDDAFDKDQDEITGGRAKKAFANDYYRYLNELTPAEYFQAMGMKPENLDRLQADGIYKKYLEERKKAEAIFRKVNPTTIKNMTTDKLIELYTGKRLSDGEPGYGHRDKLAYSMVIRPLILEIAIRAGAEQALLAKKHSDKDIGNSTEDIGFLHSYLMSNNIPSTQPEIQALVRKMETEFKAFQREKIALTKDVTKATTALYQEQFGYDPNNKSLVAMVKNVYRNLFGNKQEFYHKLYGPLVDFQEMTNTNGEKTTHMKYKTREQIEAGLKNKTISKAQYDFYIASSEMVKKMAPYVLKDPEDKLEDYIPHVAPTALEVKARRGLLGLAINSRTIDERINDVRMDFINPITKQVEQGATFAHISNVYKAYANGKRSLNDSVEFLSLKKKAIIYARRMQNQDGTPLRISNVEAGSTIGDVFVDRFAQSRYVSVTDLPSMDLNKAFMDYAHATLFQHGNENYAGMEKMLPLVDGIIALADARGHVNAKKYVETVWKEYFLKGAKQDGNLIRSATLETVGIGSNDVINFLTKSSLVYWLGYQGLAIGLGTYAIGNVLVGKYTNVKNNGGKAWALGEKRFWGGIHGFNPLNPFRGVKEAVSVLKTAGFMDINVYDDVSVETKTSLEKSFLNIALFPMIYSEKWIQGVDFLGRLTEAEWEQLKSGTPLEDDKMTELENEVKNNHGKGYQPTDQRMIQMYSWGANMLQFSRFIPTMFYDQFASRDINIYGKEHIGSYKMAAEAIQKVVRGEVSPLEFAAYRKSLNAYDRKRLDQGLIGFGMVGLMWGLNVAGNEHGKNGFFADTNPLLNLDEMEKRMVPPSFRMLGAN